MVDNQNFKNCFNYLRLNIGKLIINLKPSIDTTHRIILSYYNY